MFRSVLVAISLIFSGAAIAQEDEARTWMGDDVFLAGDDVSHSEPGADDLFMAGETLRVEAPIAGTAHLAGRLVLVQSDVDGDVYAAGYDIEMNSSVNGDVTLAGYEVIVSAPIGGDVRAAGSKVRIEAPVSGTAILTGELVTLNSTIDGDVAISAVDLVFGTNGQINGTLTIYDDEPDRIDVPETVISANRVERRTVEQWTEDGMYVVRPSWGQIVGGIIAGILVVAGMATLLVVLSPGPIARLRERALDRPFRVIWFGFLALSTMAGSGIILAMTLVGILVLPAVVIVAIVLGLIGYVLGTYILGVGVWGAIGKPMPADFGSKAIAALIGATLAALIGLIPLLGWLFILALVLMGVGAMTVSILRPVFFGAPVSD